MAIPSWSKARAEALRIMGKGAKLPAEAPSIDAAVAEFEKSLANFARVQGAFLAAITAVDKSAAGVRIAAHAYRDKVHGGGIDFGLADGDHRVKKTIMEAEAKMLKTLVALENVAKHHEDYCDKLVDKVADRP